MQQNIQLAANRNGILVPTNYHTDTVLLVRLKCLLTKNCSQFCLNCIAKVHIFTFIFHVSFLLKIFPPFFVMFSQTEEKYICSFHLRYFPCISIYLQ
jgi:hypothetical protein